MGNMKIRLVTIIILLSVFSILQHRFSYGKYTYSNNQNVFEHFPLKIDEWDGRNVPLTENVYNILETDAILVNKYVSGKNVVILSMVYYPEAKVDFHTPEGCNTGTGEKVEKLAPKEITFVVNNKRLNMVLNVFIVHGVAGDRRIYYYVYKAGDFISNSYYRLRLEMAKSYFMERKTSGALVVFSSPVYRSNEDSEKAICEFIKSSYPVITKFI